MTSSAAWPSGTNSTSELVRRTSWAATPLGPPDTWPISLCTSVEMLLACSFPMVLLWGPELVQIYNDGYAEIMGKKHPAGMGQPTSECWPEVWAFNEPVYAQVREGKTFTFEDRLFPISRHGAVEDAFFTLCYSPVRDESRAVGGILVTVVETTERIAAETTLRASEKRARENEHRLRAFLEATSDAVYTMSADWTEMRSLDGNQFLVDTADPSAMWWDSYIPNDARPRVQAAIEQAIEAKGMFDLEHPVLDRGGTVAWTHSRAIPIFNEQGDVTEWIGAATDITPLREAEKLRAALTERDTLLAEVHHRVKNNLQVITSMLEMQGRHAEDPRSHSALQEACNRVASIAGIHEILYQSKSYASVDLLAYAQQLVPYLVVFYGAQNYIVSVVEGDRATLELERAVPFGLLLNELVSNACKHAFPNGQGGRISVRLREAHEKLCLLVLDDGVGFPAGYDPRRPTSLGLQIVETLAEQLKGSITLLPEQSGAGVEVCIPKRNRAPAA